VGVVLVVFLSFVGLLQMIGGVLVALAAKSAIHEILGAISFGMGTLAIGVGALISKVQGMKEASEKQAELFQSIIKEASVRMVR
jgi:hypothetical protein